MRITNKAISAKFLNIIIRANHGQTEIGMQYGGLRSSVTCVTTSYSNDSFASPTHRTNQSMDKGLWGVVLLMHKCVTELLLCFRWILTVANTSTDGLLPSSSQCSIGDRSGDNDGQGRTRMWFWYRKSCQTPATWHLALLCWKTWSKFRCCKHDRTIGSRISSLYFTIFNVPWTIWSWVRPSWQIPAHTITHPPPKRSDSYTHWSIKRSPRLRYTR